MTKRKEPDQEVLLGPPKQGLARISEAKEFLAVSHGTLYALMTGGKIKYCKIGKSRRIPWSELNRVVEENLVGS